MHSLNGFLTRLIALDYAYADLSVIQQSSKRVLRNVYLVGPKGGTKAYGKLGHMYILRPSNYEMSTFMDCDDGCQNA